MTVAERCVALLRGINVGHAKRIAMADLRALVEGLGYRDVATLLNSGNVVFTVNARGGSGGAGARIGEAVLQQLGVSSRVTVLTASDVETIVAENTLGEAAANHSRLLATVFVNPADRAILQPLTRQTWTPEALAIGSRAAYLWCPNGILESRLPDAVARLLGAAATARNWATILKLQALLAR
jgi:uncharacterized protein (DUF1697 family)